MPFVSCPSGHVTAMSFAWLSCKRSHFWLLKTSKWSSSNVLSFRSTAGACFCGAGGAYLGRSTTSWFCAWADAGNAMAMASAATVMPRFGRRKVDDMVRPRGDLRETVSEPRWAR